MLPNIDINLEYSDSDSMNMHRATQDLKNLDVTPNNTITDLIGLQYEPTFNHIFGSTARQSRSNAVANSLKTLFSRLPHIDPLLTHQPYSFSTYLNAPTNIPSLRKAKLD
jgi:hypothetical protein